MIARTWLVTVAAMAAAALSACSVAAPPVAQPVAAPPPAPAPISGQVVPPTEPNQQGGGQDNSQVIAQLGQRSSEGGYWPASVQLGNNSYLGSVVLDGQGFTLYRFDKDSAKPPMSNCAGTCLTQWPPVLARGGRITTQNLDPQQIGSIARGDGTQQLTIGGHPVYRYINDVVPGETKGQGLSGLWFAVAPDGSKAGVSKKYGH